MSTSLRAATEGSASGMTETQSCCIARRSSGCTKLLSSRFASPRFGRQRYTRIFCKQSLVCESMLRTRYLSLRPAAMPTVLFATLAALLALSACQPKTATQTVSKPAKSQMSQVFRGAAEIQRLMAQARSGGDIHFILQELESLAAGDSAPIREEATFRKAQLMLEGNFQDADAAAQSAIKLYPQHALVPYAQFWLARWWLEQEENERALDEMRQALLHPRLTGELVDYIFDVAPALVQEAGEREAVGWLLAAAEIDLAGRDSWLRMAARRASMETVEQLMLDRTLPPQVLPGFALYAGRARLMSGNMVQIGRIAEMLAASMPNAPEIAQLESWASGEVRAAMIGVMLPLSGKYARYGQQALRGIRIALAGLEYGEYITLRIEDTASDPTTAINAYRQLTDESVNIIIGPLLAETTEALLPYLKLSTPVISLTGRMDLAHRSDALFIHTLSPLAQVNVMAEYAWQHEAERMLVISSAAEKQTEADMFVAAFEALGGEVLQTLQLESGVIDYRDRLRQLRYETDDDVVLAALDEDLNVFLPKMDMEIRMPVSFDAVYLALNGKQVALLAGQMAYADITGLPIYGSSRWQDGHLLDDRGRYLSSARFALPGQADQNDNDDSSARRFQFAHREAWGTDKTTDLMRLAYDTMRIATVMTSRLGLEERAIFDALQDPEGFPAMTGHVRFDAFGVGQKQLDVFSIKKGKIVPAG